MSLELVDETADVCCLTCSSLGYLYALDHDKIRRPELTVLPGLSFNDFCISAERGCFFCDVVLQSFLLLQFVTEEMRVELLLYADSPVELHSSGEKDFHEVVEIYPCSSTYTPFERTPIQIHITKQSPCSGYKAHVSNSGQRRSEGIDFCSVSELPEGKLLYLCH